MNVQLDQCTCSRCWKPFVGRCSIPGKTSSAHSAFCSYLLGCSTWASFSNLTSWATLDYWIKFKSNIALSGICWWSSPHSLGSLKLPRNKKHQLIWAVRMEIWWSEMLNSKVDNLCRSISNVKNWWDICFSLFLITYIYL